MQVSAALRHIVKIEGGSENVVIRQVGTMGGFHHQIPVIGIKEGLTDSCALRLPVQPDAQTAVVDAVVVQLYINGGMQLDTGNFKAAEFALHGNVIDVVVVDLTEDTAHMAYNAVLSAVIYGIAADNVGADGFFAPPDLPCAENSFHLVLVTGLSVGEGAEIMSGGGFLSQADAAALCVVDDVVFNNPAFAPVDAQQSGLVGGGRRPGTCGLRHFKVSDRDII